MLPRLSGLRLLFGRQDRNVGVNPGVRNREI
jgi:hypothetical protein